MTRLNLLPAVKDEGGLFRYCVENFRRIALSLNDVVETPIGGIIAWSGTVADIPDRWALCDGTNGTPNLQDKFIVGAGNAYAVGDTGGADNVTLTTAQMPSHTHTGPSHLHALSTHSHGHGSISVSANGDHNHTIATEGAPTATHAHLSGARDQVAGEISGTEAAGTYTTPNNGSHTHSVSGTTANGGAGDTGFAGTGATGSAGSGSSHENRPPYYALAWIMRVS